MGGMTLRGQAEAAEMGWFGDDVSTFTNMAEHMRALADSQGPDKAITGNLNAQHASADDIYDGKHELADRRQALGDLSSDQARLKLLNQFTQNDSKEGDPGGMSSSRCGSTVLIAAAIQGGGTDGIKALIEQTRKDLNPDGIHFEEQQKQMLALEEAMKKGNLKMSDLHALNGIMNEQLVELTKKKFIAEGGDPADAPLMGVSPDAMKAYIEKNDTMKGYFADGHMSIDSVDADGKKEPGANDAGDHYVLHLAGKNGGSAIYDPFARKDKNQLVFNPEEQKNYARKEVKSDQIDGADFGATPFVGMYD